MEKFKHTIMIMNSQRKIAISKDIKKLIEKTIQAVLSYEQIQFPCEISVSIVDNKNIQQLNKEFLNIDNATDVLSFPSGEYDDGHPLYENISSENPCFLGDIAISAERAEQQRIEYGHSFIREIAFLTAHSMLHLLGYDHVPPFSETEMFAKQEEILKGMGIGR